MGEYYFDIETYSPKERPDPTRDKIISIQFQKINLRSGRPLGNLNILKEWESSEKQIVRDFYNRFFSKDVDIWDFIPVGMNLNFEWEFLISKFKKYTGKRLSSRDLHYNKPHLDIKPILVLLNNGSFKGASLNRFSNKLHHGGLIKMWYENKEYNKIENYIINEAQSFLDLLERIKRNINKVLE